MSRRRLFAALLLALAGTAVGAPATADTPSSSELTLGAVDAGAIRIGRLTVAGGPAARIDQQAVATVTFTVRSTMQRGDRRIIDTARIEDEPLDIYRPDASTWTATARGTLSVQVERSLWQRETIGWRLLSTRPAGWRTIGIALDWSGTGDAEPGIRPTSACAHYYVKVCVPRPAPMVERAATVTGTIRIWAGSVELTQRARGARMACWL